MQRWRKKNETAWEKQRYTGGFPYVFNIDHVLVWASKTFTVTGKQ